jgi:hypothetical protein
MRSLPLLHTSHTHTSLPLSITLLSYPLLTLTLLSSLFFTTQHIVKDLGIEEDTIIIFTSDNGPENGAGTSGPYRERKRSLMVRMFLQCVCTFRTCSVYERCIHTCAYLHAYIQRLCTCTYMCTYIWTFMCVF